MSLVCAHCSRVNPEEAAYCYHDGVALAGRVGGPINAGSALFPHPFVFPNGHACRNFDQFALACQQHWSAAIELLKEGFLGSFFGGLGRVDLARAAAEAAKFPDLDRGLDQLLAKLPTHSLQPPRLQAEPSDVNLGQVKINENRASELHLTNLGMRILYGTVTSDCKWLTLGDGAGHDEKMFQFAVETIIPVQVRGQHLRAGTRPLEGKLTIDSNGGTTTVVFRADVPIAPYPGSMFSGAITPRQIAEKAKAAPKEAAPSFEKGDVAAWYASNGWAYPVQGPIMPSVGAIQQFFEALGVAKAPRVEFSPTTLDLAGTVGATLEAKIEVATPDRKVVYGWATCGQPWVEVGKTKLSGKNAVIPIRVKIPNPCPLTLEATLNVVGNGNQRLAIPLKVAVEGGQAGITLAPAEEIVILEAMEDDAPVELEVMETIPAAAALPPVAAFVFADAPAAPSAQHDSPFAIPAALPLAAHAPAEPMTAAMRTGGMTLPMRLGMHLLPVAVLGICLFVLVLRDIFFAPAQSIADGASEDTSEVDPRPHVLVKFDEGRLDKDYSDTMNFAVHKINPDDKDAASVKLNYYANGAGNSIVAMIDGREAVFGAIPGAGAWAKGSENGGKHVERKFGPGGKSRTYDFGGILVTQTVTVEPSDPVPDAAGDYRRLLNLCLVRYKLQNKAPRDHKVGLRVLIDTCIGDNDGVPFTLPGVKSLVSTSKDFRDAEVPDFIQVLEKPNLANPGIVLQMNLRVSKEFEPPGRFLLTRYPGKQDKKFLKWEVPIRDMGDDSSVVMYWEPKVLKKGETRELGYTYGVGTITARNDKLAITVGGATQVGGELSVVALVADPAAKDATLHLKPGLELIDPTTATQPVPPTRAGPDGQLRPSPVTWRVRATGAGRHDINVTTNNGLSQGRRVTITLKALFN